MPIPIDKNKKKRDIRSIYQPRLFLLFGSLWVGLWHCFGSVLAKKIWTSFGPVF